jgi:L-threonylcarbamoyladenylate synthase
MLNGQPSKQCGDCKTEVLAAASEGAIRRAVSILRSGGLVAFPTETVYGLGADGLNKEAVARIYEAKGRPPNNPVILHVHGIGAARPLASVWPGAASKLAERFWPGALTIVLPASDLAPDIVKAGNPTVALRCPAHPVALELLRAFGGPLAAPSANRTTEISPTKPEHVLGGLGGRIDLILDGGRTTSGIESTIISLAEAPPRLLRPGPIAPDELEAALGAPISRFHGAVPHGGIQAAPGMSLRHYAPKARLTLHSPDGLIDALGAMGALVHGENEKTVAVVFGGDIKLPDGCDHRRLPPGPVGASARLYAILHDLDSEGYQHIFFQEPPQTDEWLAVRDRLGRAAARDGVVAGVGVGDAL